MNLRWHHKIRNLTQQKIYHKIYTKKKTSATKHFLIFIETCQKLFYHDRFLPLSKCLNSKYLRWNVSKYFNGLIFPRPQDLENITITLKSSVTCFTPPISVIGSFNVAFITLDSRKAPYSGPFSEGTAPWSQGCYKHRDHRDTFKAKYDLNIPKYW